MDIVNAADAKIEALASQIPELNGQITLAERIMAKIDNRSAAARPPDQSMNSNGNYPWKTRT
jgi:outer membrane murein-binding lipoprotein Lpp